MPSIRSPRATAAVAVLLVLTACAPPGPASSGPGGAKDPCGVLHLDLRQGTLNGVPPTVSMDEAKRRLPCATGETEEGGPFNSGGGVFYVRHDFYFYTHRDYIEVRSRFPGRVTPDLLGSDVSEAERVLGAPVGTLAGRGSPLFRMPYGCLEARLARDSEVVEQIGLHARACEEVRDAD